MHDQVGTFIRCFFVGVFLITLLAGVYLWKNDERFFGVTDEVETLILKLGLLFIIFAQLTYDDDELMV